MRRSDPKHCGLKGHGGRSQTTMAVPLNGGTGIWKGQKPEIDKNGKGGSKKEDSQTKSRLSASSWKDRK